MPALTPELIQQAMANSFMDPHAYAKLLISLNRGAARILAHDGRWFLVSAESPPLIEPFPTSISTDKEALTHLHDREQYFRAGMYQAYAQVVEIVDNEGRTTRDEEHKGMTSLCFYTDLSTWRRNDAGELVSVPVQQPASPQAGTDFLRALFRKASAGPSNGQNIH